MDKEAIRNVKTGIRQEMLAKRKALPAADQHAASQHIIPPVLEMLKDRQGAMIAGYWPMQGELDILPLLHQLHQAGYSVVLPVIQPDSRVLEFHSWQPGQAMQAGRYGVYEPIPTTLPQSPSIILVPLVAYDEGNYRLGYGGGYYDATLEKRRAEHPGLIAVGCAYRWQGVRELPRETHDLPLDSVIAV